MITKPLISSPVDYVMGRTSQEYQRLRRQAHMYEAATRRILAAAGLREGMRCLDIGCGPGEVMRLMGEMVGRSGQVTGVDADGRLGREALDILQSTGRSRFAFIEADVEAITAVAGQQYDVTFGRLILFHARDPLGLLRKMYEWTKPGGTIIVQDYDLRTVDIYPRLATWSEFNKVINGVFEKAGRDVNFGIKLPAYFVRAGIGTPDGTDTHCLAWPLTQAGEMFKSVYRSLLPRALAEGITTEAASQAFLEEITRAMAGERYYSTLAPLMVGAWKQKPT